MSSNCFILIAFLGRVASLADQICSGNQTYTSCDGDIVNSDERMMKETICVYIEWYIFEGEFQNEETPVSVTHTHLSLNVWSTT